MAAFVLPVLFFASRRLPSLACQKRECAAVDPSRVYICGGPFFSSFSYSTRIRTQREETSLAHCAEKKHSHASVVSLSLLAGPECASSIVSLSPRTALRINPSRGNNDDDGRSQRIPAKKKKTIELVGRADHQKS